MSQDIIERLRVFGRMGDKYVLEISSEAADTIETLRARVAELEAEETHLDGCVANWKATAHKQAEQLTAQALTIKTMREALNIWINIAANCSIESGCCCCGESMKNHSHPMSCGHSPVDMADSIAYEAIAETDKALALPDNSTEILQEWFDKRLGEPVAFIRVSDEEDRLDGRDYEGHSLTNFVDPCGFQVFRKPEIK